MAWSPSLVVSPGDEGEVASVLSAATARGLAVVARGGGTKIDWGSPPERCDVVLSTARIEGIVDHEPADLVCVVRAGIDARPRCRSSSHRPRASGSASCSIRPTAPPRPSAAWWRPPRAARCARASGRPRDLVIGASFVLSDGTVGRSGGKVVKNVAGFDVAKLLVGSLGTLAVITEVAFRLHPLPAASRTVVLESRSVDDLCEFATRVGRLQVTPERRRPALATRAWSWCASTARSRAPPSRPSASPRSAAGESSPPMRSRGTDRGARGIPWTGAGRCGALAVLPSRVGQFLSSMSCYMRRHRAASPARHRRGALPAGSRWRWFVPRCARRRPPYDPARRRGAGGRRRRCRGLDLMRSVKRSSTPPRR